MRSNFLILLSLILTGCAGDGKHKGPGDKYVKQIASNLKNEYQIPSGELVAKYNLLKTSGSSICMFAKDYGNIISDGIAAQKFLISTKKHIQNRGMLQTNSQTKISDLYNHLYKINLKHNIISDRELRKFQTLVSSAKSLVTASPFDVIEAPYTVISADYYANLILIDHAVKHIPMFLPQTRTIMTSSFGKRKHPLRGETTFHQGTDFAASPHSMVHASAGGRVIEVARSPSYGNYILIEHSKILKTRYAHLSKVYANHGATIFQGELIGLQGNTGHSTAEHLHFEVIYKEKLVDPMVFLGYEYNCRNGATSHLKQYKLHK